jgi:small basic protein (TIGR04137 family)
MDRSLRSKSSLTRHRNVLSRDERIKILADQERFKADDCPYGLPKVAHRKAPVGGRTKKKATPEAAAGEQAAAPAAGEAKKA